MLGFGVGSFHHLMVYAWLLTSPLAYRRHAGLKPFRQRASRSKIDLRVRQDSEFCELLSRLGIDMESAVENEMDEKAQIVALLQLTPAFQYCHEGELGPAERAQYHHWRSMDVSAEDLWCFDVLHVQALDHAIPADTHGGRQVSKCWRTLDANAAMALLEDSAPIVLQHRNHLKEHGGL